MVIELTLANAVNFFMIAAGFGICGLSILQINKAPIDKRIKRYFAIFLWLVITYIMMYLTRMMLEGHTVTGAVVAIRAAVFIEFLVSGFMVFMLSLMILYAGHFEKASKAVFTVLSALLIINCVLLTVSQFTDLYYYFDANNVYHRSKLYILSNLCPVLMMALDMYLLVRYAKKYSKRILTAFWIYLLAPLAAMIIQSFIFEIKFIIIATVAAAVNMFAVIVDNLTDKYEKQRLEASRLDTELSMATRIQADMLPNIFPAFPERHEFDVFASMNPAKEVGGDFYDFFLIDEDRLGLVIADVSGKGVPAALFMMASKILVQNYAIMKKDPEAALEATNRQICQNNREEMFVTVWLGILNIETGVLTAANAGHEFPLVKAPGGKFELFKDKHGFVVGGMDDIKYKPYEIQLEKGSMLFLYTDGVVEATDAKDELFGTGRLLEALNRSAAETPKQAIDDVAAAVSEFVKDAPQFDDLTMLCVKYNGKTTDA